MANEREEAIWLHAQATISITELAHYSGLPEGVLDELVELGALSPLEAGGAQPQFSAGCVARVRTAARLAGDLDLETSALALALTFLERIDRLEARVRSLDAQLVRPRP